MKNLKSILVALALTAPGLATHAQVPPPAQAASQPSADLEALRAQAARYGEELSKHSAWRVTKLESKDTVVAMGLTASSAPGSASTQFQGSRKVAELAELKVGDELTVSVKDMTRVGAPGPAKMKVLMKGTFVIAIIGSAAGK